MSMLGDVLEFVGQPEKVTDTASERFVTVRLNGGGAVERKIGSGKTPVAFTGYRVRPGQFIYSRIDARNGAFAIIPDELDGAVVSKDFPIFAIREDRVIPDYLRHFFRSGRLEQAIRARSRGATNRQRIKEDEFLGFHIELPPLDEQRRIAAILDHADALRAKRRQVLAHLDDLTQSIFHDMFAGIAASATVDEVSAAEKGSIRTGPFGSQLLHSEFVDDGIAVLGLDNVVGNEFRWAGRRFITSEKYEKLARYTVHPGDILISIMGTTGRCVVVPNDVPTAINTKHICAVTPDRERLDPLFLRAAFLWHPEARAHLRRQTKGSIMAGLNMGIIKAMPVPVPEMSRQREFAARSEAVTASGAAVRNAIAADDELFASLQARAFRGEL